MANLRTNGKTSSKNIIVILIAGVLIFFAGYQFGNGDWSLSFNKSAVNANKDLPNQLDYSEVDSVYDDLRKKYDGELDTAKLLEGLKKGLVEASGDPYTSYLTAEEAQSFNDSLNGSFEGIGAKLAEEGDYVIIETPLSGYPAEEAGLKARDIIVEIDGEDAIGISVNEAVERIRGDKGTEVKLKVIRGGEAKEFTIVRETITLESVETEVIGDIGVIKINDFDRNSAELFNKASTDLKAKNVKGIVLDLRNNPGGYLDKAVDISKAWLDQGNIIVEEKRDGQVVESFKADKKGIFSGMPTVVLINEGSASASEITAGALKDNGVAQLVGITTFGKGSVQEPIEYSDGSLLKVTIARWFTPNGQNIDETGIEPDVKVEISEQEFKDKKDPQKDKALEILNKN